MHRVLLLLIASILTCGLTRGAVAQFAPNEPRKEVAKLLERNQLLADVARDEPNDLWDLVTKINVLATNLRYGGEARTGSSPSPTELGQITANPAWRQAYATDPAATLTLLRRTNEELRRARLRNAQSQPKRLALVIGSGGDSVWGKLATTRNDANLVADALARQGFDLVEGGAVIDPDKQHLAQAIRQFTRMIGPGTVALFYYAGHGVQYNARNFIVPAGAPMPQTEDGFDKTLIALDDSVIQQMQQAHGRLNIVILDACRDHPPLLPRGTPVSGLRAPSKGLAPMSAPSATGGSIIIFSTDPNNIARDSVDGAPDSPFATAFAAAVRDGGLEIREVFDRVEVAVTRATDHQQEPWISYSAADKFYFDPKPMGGPAVADTLGAKSLICPAAGTTVTLVQAGGTLKGIYQSPDPSDPTVCRVVFSNGEARNLLYNLYDTKYLVDDSPVKAALKNLLDGHKELVVFDAQMKTKYPFPLFSETWRRIGQESLMIDNQYVRTIVFQRDRKFTMDGAYNGATVIGNFQEKRSMLWFDPATGVVRERALQVTSGDDGRGGLSNDARVISVEPF